MVKNADKANLKSATLKKIVIPAVHFNHDDIVHPNSHKCGPFFYRVMTLEKNEKYYLKIHASPYLVV